MMADVETNSEIDVEDLEAYLYGQIYHSTLSDEIDTESRDNPRDFQLNIVNNKKNKRYYENTDISAVPQPYQPNKFIGLENSNPVEEQTGGMPQNLYKGHNLYNYQNTPYNNACQQFMLPGSPGINNIVVIPPAPPQYFSSAFHPLFNQSKRKKREHRKKNRTLVPISTQRQSNNKSTNKARQSDNKSTSKAQSNSSNGDAVVVLSDSDNSDVEEVILERTVIDISSNEDEDSVEEVGGAKECNDVKTAENEEKIPKMEDKGTQVKVENEETKKVMSSEIDNEEDDVVLVEKAVEQEIIEVEDTKDSDIMITAEEKSLQTEEVNNPFKDISNNDFLDGVNLGQHFFNFQLHGSDFYCSKSTNQSKSNINEAYETESSSSTVDIPIALNNIGFDAPCKEAFDEPNLESFANFITPKRKSDVVSTPESSKPKRKKSKSPKNDKKKSIDVIEPYEVEEKSPKKKKKGKSKEHCDDSRVPLDVEDDHDGSIILLESTESGTPKPKKKKKRKDKKNIEKSAGEEQLESVVAGEAPQSKKRKLKNKQKFDSGNANRATVSVEFTNDSDSDISIYSIDYDSDNNSDTNLSFCTVAGTANDKQEDDDSSDDFGSMSDVGEDVEVVNVKMGEEKYPPEKTDRGSRPQRKQFSDFWNDDINKFYSESWGQENFSVSESQRQMSDDPNIWKILDQDKYLYFRPRGPRCRSCRQWGHATSRCPNKSKYLKCSLCGDRGHMEPRCPKKLCTSCGQQMKFFTTYCTKCKGFLNVICKICNMRGHPTKKCPDLWRRYHLTTKEGPLVSPESNLAKPFHKRWCSGCGSQGHFEYDCKYYNRTHSATLLAIQSYDPIYGPAKKSSAKRKQENEDDLSKKKQMKTSHRGDGESSDRNEDKKEHRKQRNKEQETPKSQVAKGEEIAMRSTEIKLFVEQKGEEENSAGSCKEIKDPEMNHKEAGSKSKEIEIHEKENEGNGRNQLEIAATSVQESVNEVEKETNDQEDGTKSKENDGQDEASKVPEENHNENASSQVKLECNERADETVIEEEASTMQIKNESGIEQQGTSNYQKKPSENVQKLVENMRETYASNEPRPLSKKQRKKLARMQRLEEKQQKLQSQEKTQPQPKKKKNKNKKGIKMTDRPDNFILSNYSQSSQSAINQWLPFVSSVLNPQAFALSGAGNLQNQNNFFTNNNNNLLLENLQTLQNLLSNNAILSSPAFFMGQEPSLLGQGPSLLGQKPSLQGQKPSLLGQKPSLLGQRPSLLGQGPSTSSSSQTNVNTIDLTKSSSGFEPRRVETKGNETEMSNATQNNQFLIVLSYKQGMPLKKAHGRIFLRDLCTSKGITYSCNGKNLTIEGTTDEKIVHHVKSEIANYVHRYQQMNGYFSLPRNYFDAKLVVKENFESLLTLDRCVTCFDQLIHWSTKGSKQQRILYRMIQKIVMLNRHLIAKYYLLDGRRHVDILTNRFFVDGPEKSEFKGGEWECLNESFHHVFQNDTDQLLCIESLSNLPDHVVPKATNDEIWSRFADLNKEDRNSIHFIINNLEACICAKRLFQILDDIERNKSR